MPQPFTRRQVLDTLRQYWGFDSLRPIQEEAIRAALSGQDSLVVMPTGGGKSLCYQLPPLLTGRLTVVVSPLIALMKDQVDGLRFAGYPAAALHSGVESDDARTILSQLDAGDLRLLFLAPERLLTPGTLTRLARVADRRGGELSFAIDEAHCISQWGHDFRPEYRRMAELRETFPAAPFHAFTATATARVQHDIAAQLRLRDPAILIGAFDRPNLTYRIVPRTRAEAQAAPIIRRHSSGESAGATIIYCLSRQNTEDLAGALRAAGIDARAYHAGLTANQRRRVQDDFASERLNVIVATVAFGMGIDRSNVRCVIHACMPKSVEHYQQETGRAGRDGLPAECALLYSPGDAARWRHILSDAAMESGSEESLRVQLDLLDRMQRFAGGATCRHRALAEYFGQPYEPPTLDAPPGSRPGPPSRGCGACDVCLSELASVEDATTIARKILSCVVRVNQAFGAAHVADVLRGSRSQKITDRRHDELSTFGLLRATPRPAILSYISQLIDQGVLARSPGEYPVLVLTEDAVPVLRGERDVTLLEPKPAPRTPGRAPEPVVSAAAPGETLSPEEAALFDSLRELRLRLARERNLPPYVIFHDTVLRDMARQCPTTLEAMSQLKGVGQRKLADLGQLFADHIAAFTPVRA